MSKLANANTFEKILLVFTLNVNKKTISQAAGKVVVAASAAVDDIGTQLLLNLCCF